MTRLSKSQIDGATPLVGRVRKPGGITPDKLAKSDSEHGHQTAFFAYCAIAAGWGFQVADVWAAGEGLDTAKAMFADNFMPLVPLKWLHAIPNGGERNPIVASNMKAEGQRKGVWDTFLPFPLGNCHGCYVEFKKPGRQKEKDGGLSPEQVEFGNYVSKWDYRCYVVYSWQEGVAAVKHYLSGA